MKRLTVPLLVVLSLLFTACTPDRSRGSLPRSPAVARSSSSPVSSSRSKRPRRCAGRSSRMPSPRWSSSPRTPGRSTIGSRPSSRPSRSRSAWWAGSTATSRRWSRPAKLEDLSALMGKLNDRGFPQTFVELGRCGTADKHYYVPWMQATYVLAVNKKALSICPRVRTSTP